MSANPFLDKKYNKINTKVNPTNAITDKIINFSFHNINKKSYHIFFLYSITKDIANKNVFKIKIIFIPHNNRLVTL